MTDPVRSIYGFTFESSVILNWLELGYDFCPFTKKPMTFEDVTAERYLRAKIQVWKATSGHDVFLPNNYLKNLQLSTPGYAGIPYELSKSEEGLLLRAYNIGETNFNPIRRLRNALKPSPIAI
jgi:hypothetical protein